MRMSRWKSHTINNWRHFSYMLFNLGNNLLSQLNEKKQLRREKKKTLAKYFLIFEQMVWIVSPSIRVKWERHFDEWDVFAQIQPSHNKTSITYFYSSDFSCDIRCRSSFLSLSLSLHSFVCTLFLWCTLFRSSQAGNDGKGLLIVVLIFSVRFGVCENMALYRLLLRAKPSRSMWVRREWLQFVLDVTSNITTQWMLETNVCVCVCWTVAPA